MKYTTKLTLKQSPSGATKSRPPAASGGPGTPAPVGPDSTAESPRIVDPGPV